MQRLSRKGVHFKRSGNGGHPKFERKVMINLSIRSKENFFDNINIPQHLKDYIKKHINHSQVVRYLLKHIIKKEQYLINQCWDYLGSIDKDGYGKFNGYAAHRWMWMFTRNRSVEYLIIRHTCDNPPCNNPFHLRGGTYQDNSTDMVEKDRSLFGEKHIDSKLTEYDVKYILNSLYLGTKTIKDLYEQFNISEYPIHAIATGKNWKRIYSQLTDHHKQTILKNIKKNQIRNKIDENQVRQIRNLFQQGYTKAELSRQFNLGPTTITNIINRVSWKNVL